MGGEPRVQAPQLRGSSTVFCGDQRKRTRERKGRARSRPAHGRGQRSCGQKLGDGLVHGLEGFALAAEKRRIQDIVEQTPVHTEFVPRHERASITQRGRFAIGPPYRAGAGNEQHEARFGGGVQDGVRVVPFGDDADVAMLVRQLAHGGSEQLEPVRRPCAPIRHGLAQQLQPERILQESRGAEGSGASHELCRVRLAPRP